MKVLNLDKLSTKGQRQLRLGGVDHTVLPMTVGNYVETTLAAERMVDAGDTSFVTELRETVAMIRRSVPTASEEELSGLELSQLHAIVEFIKGDDSRTDSDEGEVEGQPEGQDPKN